MTKAQTPERPNSTGSEEVVLVFTFGDVSYEEMSPRHLYAFLPVRPSVFRFFIHANFILTSTRKDIRRTRWNRTLLEAVPEAFLGAVAQFHDRGLATLWYNWPFLVPWPIVYDEAFEAFPLRLRYLCSQRPILEDSSGARFPPQLLRTVPETFRDEDKTPLLPEEYSSRRLISRYYSAALEPMHKVTGSAKHDR
ncbi:hypothetical protein N657DRAFT_491174 [Parathielavia appendiculata]|uniref:Uncharacterized protein n=1 Tax=Parathielavia appendiculata TaxID=2587402 RepID=A0AAN6TWU0_9PEZI|nr:hypothetical protein N657DRAFT_491174 [Parathielavia appendiculata]